ncbi:hypothetical protein, partial [Trebonia sp.]|uniref:hypothetical protein n=1 Tax=Trebonia sp. TaxID=2767075 RepID=UPI0026104985
MPGAAVRRTVRHALRCALVRGAAMRPSRRGRDGVTRVSRIDRDGGSGNDGRGAGVRDAGHPREVGGARRGG